MTWPKSLFDPKFSLTSFICVRLIIAKMSPKTFSSNKFCFLKFFDIKVHAKSTDPDFWSPGNRRQCTILASIALGKENMYPCSSSDETNSVHMCSMNNLSKEETPVRLVCNCLSDSQPICFHESEN